MQTNICPACAHENRIENKFCTQCGQSIQKQEIVGPRLLILLGKKNSIVFKLENERSTIGRDLNNEIVINDVNISSSHAAVYFEDNSIWIEDLKSSNGVMVGGKRIEERTELYNGCMIKLGSTILKFESN